MMMIIMMIMMMMEKEKKKNSMPQVKLLIIFFHKYRHKQTDVNLNVLQLNAISISQQHSATNWKIAGSIPDGVFGIFH